MATIVNVNNAANSQVAARSSFCWRQPRHAITNSGAASSDGSAPDHGSCADQRPSSNSARQATPYSKPAIASANETQRINADKLETTGSRVLLRKPNSDSSDNGTGMRKVRAF